jgi:hypothetical protein
VSAKPKYEKPGSIVELATRLSDLGYWPVPIPAGHKGPTIEGWQNLRLAFDTIPDYFTAPQMLVGVLHVNLLALDVDVYDADLSREIAAEAFRRWPTALERIGQEPKTAIILRMDEPGFKVRNTLKAERITDDGEVIEAQVEVRSVTRQMVAYGRHPDTGNVYRWTRGELWETPRGDLPEATQADVQSFRDWCDDRIREWAGIPKDNVVHMADHTRREDAPPSEAAFMEALSYLPASCPYDDWLRGLMGIHEFFGGSAHGLNVAHQWSSPYPHYSRAEVDAKWRSFEVGKGVSHRSIFHMARTHGADLSAIARKHAEPQRKHAAPDLSDFAPVAASAPVRGAIIIPGAAEERAAARLEWFEDIEPALTDTYLVKNLIGAGTLSAVYGPSNSGKTFFVMDLLFHIAAGIPWRGRRVNRAAVLYLAAEGGQGIKNRVAALKRHTGVTTLPFAIRRAGLDLLQDEADIRAVCELAQEVRERSGEERLVIAVDTLSRAMAGGDENAAQDMTALIRNIDAIREATGAHIVLVHHTGKDAARGARGHSSLRAALDTEIELQAEGDWRCAFVSKQRDYQGGEEFPFSLKSIPLGMDQDGDEVTSCVVTEAEEDASRKARKGLGGNQKIIFETFCQMLGEGLGKPNPAGVGLPDQGTFWTVPMDDLRHHSTGKFSGSNPREAWRTAWKGLTEDRGLFFAASGLVWCSDKKVKQ